MAMTTEQLEKLMEAKSAAAVEKALADRDAAKGGGTSRGQPVVKSVEQLRRERLALLGLRMKALFASMPSAKGIEKSFVESVNKAIGAFEGTFSQGGAFIPTEHSSEVIEVLRDRSVLLEAGARSESYKGQLNIGKLNGGATAAWVKEGDAPPDSALDTGNVILGAHKLMVVLDQSNDALRNPAFSSAYNAGADMAAAAGITMDQGGLYGDGAANAPLGIDKQVDAGNKFAIAGVTVQNKVDDLDKLVLKVMQSKVPLAGNKPGFIMSSKTFMGLKGLREAGLWVFRSQLEASQPTINGQPVYVTDSIEGKNIIVFGLFNQLYFGNETPLEIQSAEPNFKSDVTTYRGVMRGDWKLRHNKSFALLTGVTY